MSTTGVKRKRGKRRPSVLVRLSTQYRDAKWEYDDPFDDEPPAWIDRNTGRFVIKEGRRYIWADDLTPAIE